MKVVYDIVKNFAREQGAVPSLDFVSEELKKFYVDDSSELEIIKAIKERKFFIAANFRKSAQQEKDHQKQRDLERALKKALSDLAGESTEVTVQDRMDGVCKDIAKTVYSSLTSRDEVKTHGVITESYEDFMSRQKKKKEKLGLVGKMAGYEMLDLSFRGMKPGELMLVAGYAAECKTLLCKNIALNMVTMFGYNVLFVSLEMKYEQMEDSFYTMHSADLKWNRQPLTYADVRDGFIDDNDMQFLDTVAKDLNDRSKFGRLVVNQPKKRMKLSDISLLAEAENAVNPLDFLIIDYLQLLDEQDTKELLKQAKSFALTFARGKGIPLLTPWQINREGKSQFDEYVEKGKRRKYNLFNLADSAEAERSADKVIAVAFDEKLRAAGQLEIQDLKARDDAQFVTHFLQVDNKSGRISNSASSMQTEPAKQIQDEQDKKYQEIVKNITS